MRLTSVLRKLVNVCGLFVERARFASSGLELEVDVRPTWREPRCGGCLKRAPAYDRRSERRFVGGGEKARKSGAGGPAQAPALFVGRG